MSWKCCNEKTFMNSDGEWIACKKSNAATDRTCGQCGQDRCDKCDWDAEADMPYLRMRSVPRPRIPEQRNGG